MKVWFWYVDVVMVVGVIINGGHRDDVVLDKEADVEVDKEVANIVEE